MASRQPTKQDYEYAYIGTTNLFVAVEPKGGKRIVFVTIYQVKINFIALIGGLLAGVQTKARRVYMGLEYTNTHFKVLRRYAVNAV